MLMGKCSFISEPSPITNATKFAGLSLSRSLFLHVPSYQHQIICEWGSRK